RRHHCRLASYRGPPRKPRRVDALARDGHCAGSSAVMAGTQVLTPLLERDEGLTALGDALASVASTGEGRLVLVGGDAGVGKTSLVDAACGQASPAVRILRGGC